jgi:hypothetical protein
MFKMSKNRRSIPFLLTVYVGILGALALSVGYAYSSITFETEAGAAQSRREKTVLDERIATAREIKDALRRPLPGPEPLGPITAKLANPAGSKIASAPEKKSRPKIKLPSAAVNAMAMDQDRSRLSDSYTVPDRAGSGGW